MSVSYLVCVLLFSLETVCEKGAEEPFEKTSYLPVLVTDIQFKKLYFALI